LIEYEFGFILIDMKMTGRGQITIPKAIREKCGFAPNGEVEVKLKDGVVVVEPKFDEENFNAAVKEWRGTGTKRFRELGFKSTDDFVEAIRGR
jgi:AbrB family looped-hinge helix DNA binding protein